MALALPIDFSTRLLVVPSGNVASGEPASFAFIRAPIFRGARFFSRFKQSALN
jgi:hypothetical protein